MTSIKYTTTMPYELHNIGLALESIETTLCNHLAGDWPGESRGIIEITVPSVSYEMRRLRRVVNDLRPVGMPDALHADDLPVIDETVEAIDDDPLHAPVESLVNALQALLPRIDELTGEMKPTPEAFFAGLDATTSRAVNTKLLAIGHLAALTLNRAEKCREIAAA
jgi:hypothetical protein